ncbi:bifunctional 3-(3-hydroxy-phenyl)propionate/3-hydroxycinnamic acid hydroxylase [Roseomonas sp. NAR14]|uniref:Bifunctional 3-(3-hydroxy-phenyl)propionate/3-hydroxycinnamic acid hydroxylase n=1 Tax=Roseomonas acroporae TaxID=2937791 RepID=A0A9X2BW51_9PROT|nr:bifunctional 3-(3-hydroxy-phenyl)propionate/3-hydroxycinnamic acid hydroxylase [Roseomonas acroporae]MCK8787393.1 bifunctional 3-(3-hydroxy-phenyl)propionate/3-hydroxycinnamic acid hydroxylase [Roseomonas acroporae]
MEKPLHYPVVVIGSGPIGLTLTNLLGIHGVGTAIVERNRLTVQEPRAVSIDDESLRTLQNVGVVEAVLHHVVAGYGSIYYGPSRKPFAKVEPTGRPYGYPRRNAFRQPILEQQLRDALARFPHVETFYGWDLIDHGQDAERVTLRLKGPDGQRRSVTCDYLVGCDGASSRVREGLGIQLAGTTFEERWLILDLEGNRNTTKHTEVFCDRRRPCITLPGPDDTRRYEFKLLPGETDAELLDPAMVARLLATHGADPAATLRRKVVYRFHARSAPEWSSGRVFLAGDAAHLTPPFAGQGMNSGLRDAQNLAWKLAAVLRGQLGSSLLATYQQERKDHLWQMIQLALRMGRVMAPRGVLHGLATRAFFHALNVWPAARDYVAQMKYKPSPYFASGFLVGGGSRGLVGRLLSQPEVAGPDGTRMLLDEALGPGFALLVRTADPQSAFARLDQPVWAALGARRVALLPEGTTGGEAPDGSFVAVHEVTPLLAGQLPPDQAVLLRPDRYVAATIPLAEAAAVAAKVEALVDGTWPASRPNQVLLVRPEQARETAAAA